MLQDKEDDQASPELEQMHSGELLMRHRHEEDVQVSSERSEEISMKGTGKSSHLHELLKKQKVEGQEEKEAEDGEEVLHDPIVTDSTSKRSGPAQPRPITLYHRSLFKFKLSCRSPSSSSEAPGATSSKKSVVQLFNKERSREKRDSHLQKASADELWWEKAMRMTMLVLRRLSFSVQRCYRISAECCVAGLNYRRIVHTDCPIGNRRINSRRLRLQETVETENIRHHFAPFLDSVRVTRPMDCSNDQCGWSQEYSSPAQFSWESTPVNYDNSSRQLLHRHQQQPPSSAISTIAATTELVYYSSNLMTPYEIHHSFRRNLNVDDIKSRSEADI